MQVEGKDILRGLSFSRRHSPPEHCGVGSLSTSARWEMDRESDRRSRLTDPGTSPMDLADIYLLDDFVARERWRNALLLLAMAGVAMLFFRGGVTKIIGCLLILARLVAMPVM